MKYGKDNIRIMDSYEVRLFNKENTEEKRTEAMNVEEAFDVAETKAWLHRCYKNWYSEQHVDSYRNDAREEPVQEHLKVYWQVEEITKCDTLFCPIEF